MEDIKDFPTIFEDNIPTLREILKKDLESFQTKTGFRSVWEDFEEQIIDTVAGFVTYICKDLKPLTISKTKSKSTYPDLKITHNNHEYAIDIKSCEDKTNPWYDMGRLDTFEDSHLNKYSNEYLFTVKWHKHDDHISVVDLFIEPFFKSVGFRPECDGILYRPYDGKLRPKSWDYFNSEKSYWNNIQEFKEGLARSILYRHHEFIAQWYEEMSATERAKLRKVLDGIDQR